MHASVGIASNTFVAKATFGEMVWDKSTKMTFFLRFCNTITIKTMVSIRTKIVRNLYVNLSKIYLNRFAWKKICSFICYIAIGTNPQSMSIKKKKNKKKKRKLHALVWFYLDFDILWFIHWFYPQKFFFRFCRLYFGSYGKMWSKCYKKMVPSLFFRDTLQNV